MVEVLVIISLSILVSLQESRFFGSSSVKAEFVRLIVPCGQQYFSMSVIPRELVLGSICSHGASMYMGTVYFQNIEEALMCVLTT